MIAQQIILCTCNWTDWLTSLNPIELILGGLLGAFLGWFISVIHARETERLKRKRLREKYSPITGHFICYFAPNGQRTDRIISQAVIEYVVRNQLTIELTTLINQTSGQDFTADQIQVWTGEITMDSVRNGIIVWEFRQPDHLIGTNGFKRIIVDKDFNGISLVGESGYGVEKMERKNE
jgi:hypothetical protein